VGYVVPNTGIYFTTLSFIPYVHLCSYCGSTSAYCGTGCVSQCSGSTGSASAGAQSGSGYVTKIIKNKEGKK
jgi:hypothetical protein